MSGFKGGHISKTSYKTTLQIKWQNVKFYSHLEIIAFAVIFLNYVLVTIFAILFLKSQHLKFNSHLEIIAFAIYFGNMF